MYLYLLDRNEKVFEFKTGNWEKLERRSAKKLIMKVIPRDFGAINPEFSTKYKLSSETKLHQYADIFILF